MVRFGFSIRTRTGQRIDNIQIVAETLGDAERRLEQMYVRCQIIGRSERAVRERGHARSPFPHIDSIAAGSLQKAPLR